MREGWKQENLGNLCAIKTGRKDVRQGNPDGVYPFFTCAKNHTFSDDYSFDAEAILIAGNGDVGYTTYFKGKFEAYQRTYVLLDFKEVEPSYLFLILNGLLKNALYDQRLGNTMPYIKKGMLTEFPIPLPPLTEQKRIVAILDEAFVGIATTVANTEKNLANARELFESYLNAVFSSAGEAWKSSTLEDSCQIKPPKREIRNRLSAKDRVSFVPMNDLGIREKKLKAMEDRPYEAVSAAYTYFADGDVLLAKITPCFENGKIGIASELTNGVGFGSSEFIVLRPGPLLDAEYLFYFLSRDSFRSSGASVMSGAVGHKRVPNEFIARCLISLPPISEQKRIVAILDELSGESRRLKSIYQQKLNVLAELKQSLLKKALSGELTVTPQDEIETALA